MSTDVTDAVDREEARSDGDVQVLEFQLGDETYCVDIEYVAEIVDMGDLTVIPNSPRHIEGVMDLRGRTTSIVDPKTVLNVTGEDERRRIIVFDPEEMGDGEATGWIVDEVYQVVRTEVDAATDQSVADRAEILGMVKREDRFVIWLDPEQVGN